MQGRSAGRDGRIVGAEKVPSAIFGRDTMTAPEQRQMIFGLLDEAQAAGARLRLACQTIDLAERTVQRWRDDTNVSVDRPHIDSQQPTTSALAGGTMRCARNRQLGRIRSLAAQPNGAAPGRSKHLFGQ